MLQRMDVQKYRKGGRLTCMSCNYSCPLLSVIWLGQNDCDLMMIVCVTYVGKQAKTFEANVTMEEVSEVCAIHLTQSTYSQNVYPKWFVVEGTKIKGISSCGSQTAFHS